MHMRYSAILKGMDDMDTFYANVITYNDGKDIAKTTTIAGNWLANVDTLKLLYPGLTEVHMCTISATDNPTEEEERSAEEWMSRQYIREYERMGTIRKICISGFSNSEMDLIEMKIRELAAQIGKVSNGIVKIWRVDEDDGEK